MLMASSSSSSSSKYPYPSKLNVANFVSIKLSENNYPRWKSQMNCLIVSQDLVGFIDGSLNPPAQVTISESYHGHEEDFLAWRRTDHLLKGWIFGSLSEVILDSVFHLETARDVWKSLEKKFGHQTSQNTSTPIIPVFEDRDTTRYLPLYRATLKGDWEAAKKIFDQDYEAVTARITSSAETALHIAVGRKKSIHFVKNLVELMPINSLSLENCEGDTALGVCAIVGNTEAAKLLLPIDPGLLRIPSDEDIGRLPLNRACQYGNKHTTEYLPDFMKYKENKEEAVFTDLYDTRLLVDLIDAGFFGRALDLVRRFPHLATRTHDDHCPLTALAKKASAFSSGFLPDSLWKRILFVLFVPVPVGWISNSVGWISNSRKTKGGHIEDPSKQPQVTITDILLIVPYYIKKIQEERLERHQALQLLKCLCEKIKSLVDYQREPFDVHKLKKPLQQAIETATEEVVEEILKVYPDAIRFTDDENRCMFQLAVLYRCEYVLNLICDMSGCKRYLTLLRDSLDNNILHLAGRLAPLRKLNHVSSAAMKVQSELLWFKKVEKLVSCSYKEDENIFKETPAMVFSKEHKNLVIEGERWMKNAATSCSIVAALIATIVFTAAFTVPGGNNDNTGLPILSKTYDFKLFIIFDSLSLVTSVTSLLVFVSILTMRYNAEDFLYALPRRLAVGLLTLYFSITFLMMAFAETIFLIFDQVWGSKVLAWFCLFPILSFTAYQGPLLSYLKAPIKYFYKHLVEGLTLSFLSTNNKNQSPPNPS